MSSNTARIAAQDAYIERRGPLDAEIIEGLTPRWHILQTSPCREHDAAEYLSERKFGVYLPYYGERTKDRFGKPNYVVHTMFPGYLFVFVWGLLLQRRRILACPGVSAIVYFADEPAVVPDEQISRIQTGEFMLDLQHQPKPRRRWRRSRYAHQSETDELKIRSFDALHNDKWLDGSTRNLLLVRVLGLTT